MNITTTMRALYVIKARFDYLARQLHDRGCQMAAEELRREVYKLGCQISQVEGVLSDYKIDIAAAQAVPEKPAKFYGVDMAEVKQ